MRLWEPLDQASVAQASEFVAQASLGQSGRREIEQVCQMGLQFRGRERAGVEAEVDEGTEEGLGAGLAEA